MSDEPEQRLAKCNACGFTVPWDRIGKELMDAHLKDKHPSALSSTPLPED